MAVVPTARAFLASLCASTRSLIIASAQAGRSSGRIFELAQEMSDAHAVSDVVEYRIGFLEIVDEKALEELKQADLFDRVAAAFFMKAVVVGFVRGADCSTARANKTMYFGSSLAGTRHRIERFFPNIQNYASMASLRSGKNHAATAATRNSIPAPTSAVL